MKYPKLLEKNDDIGITALSSGASDSIETMNEAIKNLEKYFNVYATQNVYGSYIVSSTTQERVKELNELIAKKVKLILLARGGDYLYEILDYLDFDLIKNSNIWFEGASDATGLLYILTTKYDIATIYGKNAKRFSELTMDNQININLLQNNLIKQTNFKDRDVLSVNGNFTDTGIIIGGCFDSIKNIIGTKFDNTNKFIEKYRDKKIIWYFDIFAMNSLDVYLSLLQLKYAGWFKYSDTFIFGSIMFETIYGNITYEDAIKKALSDKKNIILNANIGHIDPVNIIINGSLAKIKYDNGNYELIEEFIDSQN